MTVGTRKNVDRRGTQLFAVGHDAFHGASAAGPSNVMIAFGKNLYAIYEHEVFKANEAADFFFYHCKSDDIPSEYLLHGLRFPEYESDGNIAGSRPGLAVMKAFRVIALICYPLTARPLSRRRCTCAWF
jgi:hypothetical protein